MAKMVHLDLRQDASDYLARDATWKEIPGPPPKPTTTGTWAFWVILGLGLLVTSIWASANFPIAYPIGQEQGGAIGNKTWGHVWITHGVTFEKGAYVYRFAFHNGLSRDVRITWGVLDEPVYCSPLQNALVVSREVGGAGQPLWRLERIRLEVLDDGQWKKVGVWAQSGPVPLRK